MGPLRGLHPNHIDVTGIPALIANRTNPSISVRVERVDINNAQIASMICSKVTPVGYSTSDGLLVRRRLKLGQYARGGSLLPARVYSAAVHPMGLVDPSAMVMEDLEVSQFDPLQRLRIRKAIKQLWRRGKPFLLWRMMSWTEL